MIGYYFKTSLGVLYSLLTMELWLLFNVMLIFRRDIFFVYLNVRVLLCVNIG